MLFDQRGNRKYLSKEERLRFLDCADRESPDLETFCHTLAFTGARISEVLALTPQRIDVAGGAIVIESLKKRRRGIFRAVPVPARLMARLEAVHKVHASQRNSDLQGRRLWNWSRMTAWARVKAVMLDAGIAPNRAMPKALRHAFGVNGIQNGVALNIVQRWLGHADIATTAIYAEAIGDEERAIADRMWL